MGAGGGTGGGRGRGGALRRRDGSRKANLVWPGLSRNPVIAGSTSKLRAKTAAGKGIAAARVFSNKLAMGRFATRAPGIDPRRADLPELKVSRHPPLRGCPHRPPPRPLLTSFLSVDPGQDRHPSSRLQRPKSRVQRPHQRRAPRLPRQGPARVLQGAVATRERAVVGRDQEHGARV